MKARFLKGLGVSYDLGLKSKRGGSILGSRIKIVTKFSKGDLKDLGLTSTLNRLTTFGRGRLVWSQGKKFQGETQTFVRLVVELKLEGVSWLENWLSLVSVKGEGASWPSKDCYCF